MTQPQRGFTLVELSIVLVILGLLVGGVLTGQSLIRAAELRSISTQYQRYITSVMTFRDKYFAIPGDMTNANAYWGAADGSTGNTSGCKTVASTTTATCNGDGSGKINATATASDERFRFWQHLANAGLIEGNYTGSNPSGTTLLNSPAGRISGTIWYAIDMGTQTNTSSFDGQYDNVLMIGGLIPNNIPYGFILKPEEAYNLDMKLDDGKPGTGKLVPFAFDDCTTTYNSYDIAAEYQLQTPSLACALIFRQQF